MTKRNDVPLVLLIACISFSVLSFSVLYFRTETMIRNIDDLREIHDLELMEGQLKEQKELPKDKPPG